MIAILSPAKNIDMSPLRVNVNLSHPKFLSKANELAGILKRLSVSELQAIYRSNQSIAQQNFERLQMWQTDPDAEHTKAAAFAFNGEAFRGFDAKSLTDDALLFSTSTIRILSGLYGILSPLDVIQPYRLEMGSSFELKPINNLYDFWRKTITSEVNRAIDTSPGDKILVNIASNEYSKTIDYKSLKYPVLTIDFKEEQGGKLKTVSVYAKRARGLMARYIASNQIDKVEFLKAFDFEGYYYNDHASSLHNWVFVRPSI
jgi:cytoplasmic iron level regulating protein YaaA (DUF328/UPF0246 family)